MGRRSLHTADELRELILEASTDLIKEHGLAGLSAREIARRINYSPGTLYNSFDNLDDLVLTIEGRLLDSLMEALAALPEEKDAKQRVHLLANRYLKFASDNPKLWNLLFEHHIPQSQAMPDWYRQKLEAVMGRVEGVLAPVAGGLDEAHLRRSARVLWASVHGLSSLSAAHKLAVISSEDATLLMDDLVTTYLNGLEAAGR
jgi:AcrR family transcriptional regulator